MGSCHGPVMAVGRSAAKRLPADFVRSRMPPRGDDRSRGPGRFGGADHRRDYEEQQGDPGTGDLAAVG